MFKSAIVSVLPHTFDNENGFKTFSFRSRSCYFLADEFNLLDNELYFPIKWVPSKALLLLRSTQRVLFDLGCRPTQRVLFDLGCRLSVALTQN